MAKIISMSYYKAGKKDGCLCDRCGQYITSIWSVTFTDGITAKFGCDCFDKMRDGKLNAYGEKLFKKIVKELKSNEQDLNDWKTGKHDMPEEDWKKQNDDESSWNRGWWSDMTFAEYKRFQIEQFYPEHIKRCLKQLEKFSKVNFDRGF